MNPPSHFEPDDPEKLLRTGLRETTPEFEKRWADLKRELRQEPAPRPAFAGLRQFILLTTAGAMAVVAIMLFVKQPGPARLEKLTISPTTITGYGELLDLDSALRGALPLTNTENLEVLQNLPLSNGNHS